MTFAEDGIFQTTEPSHYIAIVLILILNFFNYIKNKKETSLLKIETIFINSILLFSNVEFDNFVILLFPLKCQRLQEEQKIQHIKIINIFFMIASIYYS